MKPKPQSDVKPGPHKMRVENSQDGQFDATSASAEAFPKPPSSTANRSAQSRKQFRETWSSIAPSLKVISPDEMFEQAEDLEIQEFGSDYGSSLSDGSDNEAIDEEEIAQYLDTLQLPQMKQVTNLSRDGSMFQVVEPGRLDKESTIASDHADWEKVSEVNTARQLSLLEREATSDIDTDEETEIMKEIRAEITNQVRNEMRGELVLMKKNIQDNSGANDLKKDDDHVDPEIREGLLKIKKLDKVLARKLQREKRVKRERIVLQHKLRVELDELKKPSGKREILEEKTNTSKFLALTLPPRHNAGIKINEAGEVEETESESPPLTPLFRTQLPEEYEPEQHCTANGHKLGKGSLDSTSQSDVASETSDATRAPSQSSSQARSTSKQRTGSKSKRKKNKNFIRINMEKASDAANAVAMTDDEKQRVNDLLGDIDEIPESFADDSASTSGAAANPYQITLSSSDGFHPARDEMRRLEAIDQRLQRLLPRSDFESIASTSPRLLSAQPTSLKPRSCTTIASKSSSFSATTATSSLVRATNYDNVDIDRLGEQALRETKEERDLSQRLKEIEAQLEGMSATHAQPARASPPDLPKAILDSLLTDCVRSLSMTGDLNVDSETPDAVSTGGHTTPRNGMSVASRTSVLSNVRPLDPDLLQELLSNARREICGSDSEDASERSTPTNVAATDDQFYSSQANFIASETAEKRQRARRLALEAARDEIDRTSSAVNNDITVSSFSRPSTSESVSGSQLVRQPPQRQTQSPHQRRSAAPSASFLPEIDPQGRMSTQRSTSGLSDSNTSPSTSATPRTAAQAPVDGRNAKPLWKQSNSKSSSKLDADANSEHHPRMPRPPKHKPKIKRNNSESVL